MEHVLTYAMPVHVLDLGPSLEVYFETLPAVNALRCCHKNGKGAAISKLPRELINEIEDLFVQSVRDQIRSEWGLLLRCREMKCDDAHMTFADKLRVYSAYIRKPKPVQRSGQAAAVDTSTEGDGAVVCEDQIVSEEQLDAMLSSLLSAGELRSENQDLHDYRKDAEWSQLVESCFRDQERIKQSFGIQVWWSNVRLYPVWEAGAPMPTESTDTT